MKNITKHFLERWTERVVGIETIKERDTYIGQNREQIREHANRTFEFSQFIYKGQIGDNVTRNYHIKDNLVFVTNTSDDAFITVYKVDLGFKDELNDYIRRELVKDIVRLQSEKEEADFKMLEEVESKTHEVEMLTDNIKLLKEQLYNLENEAKFKQQEISNIKKQSLNIGIEIKRQTLMLVNSKEYKKDLTTMK